MSYVKIVTNNDSLRGWLENLRAAGRAPGTIAIRRSYVSRFMDYSGKDFRDCGSSDVTAWLASSDWGASARRGALGSLRSFYRWAIDEGLCSVDPTSAIPAIRQPRSLPRPAPDAYIRDALARCDEETALAISLMALAGLRRAEVATVRAEDITPRGQVWLLRVSGKGGHTRLVPLPPWLARKLAQRRGWIFPGAVNGHISPGWLGKRVSRVLPPGWTPHTLRHRFGTVAHSTGGDLVAVQRLLGHASLATTQIYVDCQPQSLEDSAAGAWHIAA